MTRSTRLLKLLDLLRGRRGAVQAEALAERLGVSVRTIYRDIASLRAQGAEIDGAAGTGYRLREGYLLPSLMFDAQELEALTLGMRLIAQQADPELVASAEHALRRITAQLPAELRLQIDTCGLLVPAWNRSEPDRWAPLLRQAIRLEHAVAMRYRDAEGVCTERRVWPFAIVFLDRARLLGAWCEHRSAFRIFRVDRVIEAADTGLRYPHRRHTLLQRYRDERACAGDGLGPPPAAAVDPTTDAVPRS